MIKQRAFTLVEVLITITLLGMTLGVFSIVSDDLVQYLGLEREYENRQELRAIAQAHVDYSTLNNNGQLLPPYTSGSCYNCPLNPTVSELVAYAELDGKRSASELNYDVSPQRYVRGLMLDATTYQSTFSIASAVNLVIEFRHGVVVQTNCKQGATCDTSSTWATPAFVRTGWSPNAQIEDSIPINNLRLLQNRAVESINRVQNLQRTIRNVTQEFVVGAPSIVDTNYLPVPDLPSTPNRSGQNPTSNGGCIKGWWDLSSVDVNILQKVGLDTSYGSTLFGGAIQFCADFDQSATDATNADKAPHRGALRVNRFITRGNAPASSNTDNIIFPI